MANHPDLKPLPRPPSVSRISDWQGWDAQNSFPDMPASSQDVSDSDDMIDDDDDDDVG